MIMNEKPYVTLNKKSVKAIDENGILLPTEPNNSLQFLTTRKALNSVTLFIFWKTPSIFIISAHLFLDAALVSATDYSVVSNQQ